MDVAKMFIKYKLPLNIIQDEVFKNPFKRLQFDLQSENDLGLSILHLYNKEKQKLLRYFDELSSRFNLTVNLWEDDTKEIVNCCLTVQFIDDSWTLKKKILSFERLKHDFDAASLCEIFKRVLLDWNIKEKTCSLTVHSSLSNVEIVHDGKIWPSGIFYLSYDKCIRDINCMIVDISLKSIYQVYEEMNQQDNIGHTLMNVECSNNWRICSLILAIVAILHPSLKLDFVEFVYKGIYGDAIANEHLDKISNFLRSLYDKYASSCSNYTKFTTTIGDTCSLSLANTDDKVLDSFRKYKYLLWDFAQKDLELLGKWKNTKITGQHVGLDEKLKVQDKFLAPLVIPLVDAIIQGTPQAYYIGEEVLNTYFRLLMKRSEKNSSMFLKHTSLDSSTALFLPLCFSSHWTLFYVDIKDRKFVWLDSRKDSEMQMPSNFERILEWFKGSLLPAMGLNNARDWPFAPGDIPKQENGIDCGIFVMKYADCLTHANCIGFPFSQDDMPHFRERIFLDIYNGEIHVPEKFIRS
ncbi:hypothetical protein SLA2020_091230 [Shorea laevis]